MGEGLGVLQHEERFLSRQADRQGIALHPHSDFRFRRVLPGVHIDKAQHGLAAIMHLLHVEADFGQDDPITEIAFYANKF